MGYPPRKRLEENLIASFAQVTQLYGIPSTIGRLYAVLYLSPAALSLADLSEATGIAKSTTSVALRRLERMRFVRRLPRSSDRRDYYQAVTDPMEVMQDLIRYFVMPELELGGQMVASFDVDLRDAIWAEEYTPDEAAIMKERLGEMQRSLEAGRLLVGLMASEDGLERLGIALAQVSHVRSAAE
jgi:DNA-binding transcriptional regulator GbsR (MarR family)